MAAASCRRPGLSCYEFVVFQGFRRRFLNPGAAIQGAQIATSEFETLVTNPAIA